MNSSSMLTVAAIFCMHAKLAAFRSGQCKKNPKVWLYGDGDFYDWTNNCTNSRNKTKSRDKDTHSHTRHKPRNHTRQSVKVKETRIGFECHWEPWFLRLLLLLLCCLLRLFSVVPLVGHRAYALTCEASGGTRGTKTNASVALAQLNAATVFTASRSF